MGALMGGPIAERAELTDKNPPRLERYDRWGHDVSQVVMPATFEASKARPPRQRASTARLPASRPARAGVPHAPAERGVGATCSTRPRSA